MDGPTPGLPWVTCNKTAVCQQQDEEDLTSAYPHYLLIRFLEAAT